MPTGSFGTTSTTTGNPGKDSVCPARRSRRQSSTAAGELVLGAALEELDELGPAGRVVVRDRGPRVRLQDRPGDDGDRHRVARDGALGVGLLDHALGTRGQAVDLGGTVHGGDEVALEGDRRAGAGVERALVVEPVGDVVEVEVGIVAPIVFVTRRPPTGKSLLMAMAIGSVSLASVTVTVPLAGS